MKKILLSLLTIGLVAAAVGGLTGAYFSDTETSEGNTFVAGALDLKVDSECHYNGMVCLDLNQDGEYLWENEGTVDPLPMPELLGTVCECSWDLRDIDAGDDKRFFDLVDVKPGDWGEVTLSLHVYNNDAWGRASIDVTSDSDENGIDSDYDGDASTPPYGKVEPEDAVSGPNDDYDDGTTDGDLDDYLMVSVWEDFGVDADGDGNLWDGEGDELEGDNQVNGQEEPSEPAPLSQLLVEEPTLIDFGELMGSTTYYYGVRWTIPTDEPNINIIQSDRYVADIIFDVVQKRHNPTPWE